MGKIDLAGRLSDARARVEAETPPEARVLAKYQRLTRKDTLIRSDQQEALTALARTLMRTRRRRGERITENTLIRIAIDLLLAHADQLRGSTEDELRISVTPELPTSRTSAPTASKTIQPPNSGSPALRDFGTAEAPNIEASKVRSSRSPAGRNTAASRVEKRWGNDVLAAGELRSSMQDAGGTRS